MKNIIGILGVAVLAITLFLGTNSNNTDLSDVLAINIANAEEGQLAGHGMILAKGCRYTGSLSDTCNYLHYVIRNCTPTTVPYVDNCGIDPH